MAQGPSDYILVATQTAVGKNDFSDRFLSHNVSTMSISFSLYMMQICFLTTGISVCHISRFLWLWLVSLCTSVYYIFILCLFRQ